MSIHYNLNALSKKQNFTVYDLNKSHVIGSSTCNALYRHLPIQTDTLQRILEYCDCRLKDFLRYDPETELRQEHRKIDLNDMVRRGVISRTSKRRFLDCMPMSLTTLDVIADDQGVDLLDFVREEPCWFVDSLGNLKKSRKVIYLCEW